MISKAIEKIDNSISELNTVSYIDKTDVISISDVIKNLREIRSILSEQVEGGKFIGEKECPGCARKLTRFELTNYSPEHMCDGCGFTYGHIVGSWNLILKKILDNKKDENDF